MICGAGGRRAEDKIAMLKPKYILDFKLIKDQIDRLLQSVPNKLEREWPMSRTPPSDPAVLALVGATLQFRFRVPLLVIGEPVTVKSEDGALKPTLVTVPAPGNVWPEMNVTLPV